MAMIAITVGYGLEFDGHAFKIPTMTSSFDGNERFITNQYGRRLTWQEIVSTALTDLEEKIPADLMREHYKFCRVFAVTITGGTRDDDIKFDEILDLDNLAWANEITLVPTGKIPDDVIGLHQRYRYLHLRHRSIANDRSLSNEFKMQLAQAGFYRDENCVGSLSCFHCHEENIPIRETFGRTWRQHSNDSPNCPTVRLPWSVVREMATRQLTDDDKIVIILIRTNRERIYLKKIVEEQKQKRQTDELTQRLNHKATEIFEEIRRKRIIPMTTPKSNPIELIETLTKQFTELKEGEESRPIQTWDKISATLRKLNEVNISRRCVACLTKEATIVQLPCLHKIMCSDCYRSRRRTHTTSRRRDKDPPCGMCQENVVTATATFPLP